MWWEEGMNRWEAGRNSQGSEKTTALQGSPQGGAVALYRPDPQHTLRQEGTLMETADCG